MNILSLIASSKFGLYVVGRETKEVEKFNAMHPYRRYNL